MAETHSIDAGKLKQASELFEEIAQSSLSIDKLCYRLGGDIGDPFALNDQIDLMRTLVARIGWLADLGAKKLTGAESIKGGPEEWMLPPSYFPVDVQDGKAAQA